MAVKTLLLSLNDENEGRTSPTKPDGAPHLYAISMGFPGVWAADLNAGWGGFSGSRLCTQ